MITRHSYFIKKIFNYDICLQSLGFLNEYQQKGLEKIILQISYKPVTFNSSFLIAFSLFVLELISLQKPNLRYSTKDVALWKIRKNHIVSCLVTLRGNAMFSFLDKFLYLVVPKLKEFEIHSLFSKSNIQKNAYSFKIFNFFLFPEIEAESARFYLYKNNFKFLNLEVVLVFKSVQYSKLRKHFLISSFRYPIKL